VWTRNFAETLPPGAGGSTNASEAASESFDDSTDAGISMSLSVARSNQTAELLETNRAEQAAIRRESAPPALAAASTPFGRPAIRGSFSAQRSIVASQHDEALVDWLSLQTDTMKPFEDSGATEMRASEDMSGADDIDIDSVEQVFAQLASN
jgi:hypothetical protein